MISRELAEKLTFFELLQEIESREYWWEISHRMVDNGIKKYTTWVSKKHVNNTYRAYTGSLLEETLLYALLWILEQEAGK